ncbi:MAG: leucyl/phenylalanyl-tRNA--protein transferase [Ignavibacteriales bacterium]|nr:leucyl/phenylalanyl-tRNA--protein transferase [Ignavibacteriales bacterium]
MIRLYSIGAFPMSFSEGLNWYIPSTRCVIYVNNFNYPRSLRQFIKKNTFLIKFDFDTINIIRNCAARNETWISEKLIDAYMKLINEGYLHSVAVFQNEKLVGGLFGITINGVFIGESMFNTVPQTSKVALINLLERLKERKYKICDVQFLTPLLKLFGATEISFDEYKKLLKESYKIATTFA